MFSYHHTFHRFRAAAMCLLAFVIPCCGLAASHPDGPQKLSLNAGWHFVRLDSPTAGHATSYGPLISPPQVPAYRGEAVGGGSHGHTQPAVAATRTWRHRRPFGRRAYIEQATGVHRAGDDSCMHIAPRPGGRGRRSYPFLTKRIRAGGRAYGKNLLLLPL